MNLTITQNNTGTEIFGNEGSSLAHKLYEIASDQNNTVNLTGSINVPYAYVDEVEYLNNNFGPKFNITARDTWIKFYHQEIEDAILSSASQNPGSFGSNFASSGHITQDDADSLTQWGITFTGNTNITQFNEFEKFRNVTQVPYNDCFQGCTNLQSIKLPPRLTYIRGWMFNGCSSLSGVVLPASCTTIDTAGFAGCTSLTSIDLSNVTTLGNSAFKNSGITGVLDLPNLTGLSQDSFYGCTGLTSVTYLGSITYIPVSCFYGCTSLTSVILPETCTSFRGVCFYECTSLGEVTFPSQATISISSSGGSSWGAFCGCTSLIKINNLQNLSGFINEKTFNRCPLTSNNLSELINVTGIGSSAFEGSGISASGTTSLPNITSISSNGFYSCTNLTGTLDFPNLTSIGNKAFQDCSGLTSINLSNVTNINTEAFVNCKSLTSVTFSSSPITLGDSVFDGCINLTGNINITLLNQYFPKDLFKNSKITRLIIHGNNLLSPTGNMGRAYHGWQCLPECVYIDLSDTKITNGQVVNCPKLTTIIFPETITSIPWDCMDNCNNLQYFILLNSIPPSTHGDLSLYMFKNDCGPNASIYVPDGSVTAYKTEFSTVEDKIKGISELPSDITWSTKQ